MYAGAQGIQGLGARAVVTGRLKLPDMGTWNKTGILCKSSFCFLFLYGVLCSLGENHLEPLVLLTLPPKS